MPNAIDQLHAAFTGEKTESSEYTGTELRFVNRFVTRLYRAIRWAWFWRCSCLKWMETAKRYHEENVRLLAELEALKGDTK